MSWSRQQIRTGGWKRGARFVDERAYTGALEDLASVRDELHQTRALLGAAERQLARVNELRGALINARTDLREVLAAAVAEEHDETAAAARTAIHCISLTLGDA